MRSYLSIRRNLLLAIATGIMLACTFSPFTAVRAVAQRTYYVATNGSNNNNGVSVDAPFATIAYAATQTAPGDTVLVEDGTYSLPDGGFRGDAAIASNGAAGERITYKAQNKWKAKLVGTGNGDGSTVIGISGAYNIIQDFDITGTDANGIILASTGTTASYNQAIGNYVHDMQTPCDSNGGSALNSGGGSNYSGVSHLDFLGNLVVNIQETVGCGLTAHSSGIYEAVPYGMVANNIVIAVNGPGIQSWHNAYNETFFGNDVISSYDGIVVGDGDAPGGVTNDNTLVQNNISINNTYCGICEDGATGSHNQYSDNLVSGNSTNILLKNGLTATGTVSKDPQFVNNTGTAAGNYEVQSSSPALGAGLALAGVLTDYLGEPRPQAGATVIGACLGTGTSTAGTGSPTGPVAAGVNASPTSIVRGQSSIITWTTQNAVTATLDGTPVALNGSLAVNPHKTTTYKVVATGSTGTTGSGSATVTVN
jgi:hypothetical protein